MALIESEIYNRFARDLDLGLDVVDRESYEIIIDSRRKEIIRNWLQGKRGIILDYGCGDGTFSRFFKNILNPDVVGLDISAGMRARNVTFRNPRACPLGRLTCRGRGRYWAGSPKYPIEKALRKQ